MGVRNGLVFNIGPHVKSDASRAATYSKRKKGLLKKVKELSILCGVDVAIMCHHPQMAGAPPLLWGQPNLQSVLNRYKGVASEEREKRKLDNTTFLHTQVQKLAADLQHSVDHNRKLVDHLENSVWDDRLDSYSAAELQQVAGQVFRKKKEVAELLTESSAAAAAAGAGFEDRRYELSQPEVYNQQLAVDIPASHMGAASSPFMLAQSCAHNEHVVSLPGGHDLMMHQLLSRMPAFRSSDAAGTVALLQSANVTLGATVPNQAAMFAMTLPSPSITEVEPAESENSIVSGRKDDRETPAPSTSSLLNLPDHHGMFATTSAKALGAADDPLVDDEFGAMDMVGHIVDTLTPAWYCAHGLPTTPTASDDSDSYCNADAAAHSSHIAKVPSFAADVFDIWSDGMGFAAAAGFLQQCQPNQILPPDAGILVPHVT